MQNLSVVGSPEFPEIVGFELPAAEHSDDQREDQLAIVMLNATPSRDWVAAFLEQTEHFKAQHQLTDVRIVGSQITLIGRFDDARTLTTSTKVLVQNIAQTRMHDRLRHRAGSQDPVTPSQVTHIVQEGDESARDVAAAQAIPDAQNILAEVIRITGMRCAAIARLTDKHWTACAVYDLLEFGLKPGQNLVLEMTICNEVRKSSKTVEFGQASAHPVYAHHPIPALYGFESYISVPILTAQGQFFGTLCALDPKPTVLEAATISTVEDLAKKVGSQLSISESTPPTP